MAGLRRAVVLALVAVAALAGSARADTFEVLGARSLSGVLLPSAMLPNLPGAVAFPTELSTPPATAAALSDGQLLALWQSAGAAYGVPWTVLAAINKVESNFGRNMGPSSAGAVGWMQFLPSTWLQWGVDATGDGIADPWNPRDAVYSAARYLAAAGGAADLSRAVYAYNHAGWYVSEVLALSDVYAQGAGVAFSLDRLQQSLDRARNDLADASGRLVAAQRRVRGLTAFVNARTRRAAAQTLLSSRLVQERIAGAARVRLAAARARARAAQGAVASARAELVRARAAAAPSAFAPSVSPLLAAPSYSSGRAFPVGGGAAVVSVARARHGDPAADIAAPAGSPVYALADGVVERTWTQSGPGCGIGFSFRGADGRTWTYCHLAYLEPSVTPGATLSAGARVGLVGSTGGATGPYLRLQLDPATAAPQREPWFRAFAGSAFTWQGSASAAPEQPAAGIRFLASAVGAPASAGHAVFAVVPTPAPGRSVVYFTRP